MNGLIPGICFGFQVMEREESPNVPFTIFRTRFPTGDSFSLPTTSSFYILGVFSTTDTLILFFYSSESNHLRQLLSFTQLLLE